MRRKQSQIYVIKLNNDMEAHKNLSCLVERYPIIPYYKLYRTIKKHHIAEIQGYTIKEITLYG